MIFCSKKNSQNVAVGHPKKSQNTQGIRKLIVISKCNISQKIMKFFGQSLPPTIFFQMEFQNFRLESRSEIQTLKYIKK